MSGYRGLLAGAALVATVTVASPACAQLAGLKITVVDEATGAPVADADVIVTNAEIGFDRTVRTDGQGQLVLDGLSTAGSYSVRLADADPETGSVPLALRSNFTQSVTLRRAEAAIVVTGTRATSGVNTVNAEVSGTLSAKELRDLPIEGRDVISALIRLPNVVPSTGFFSEAPTVSINGANGLFTNYLIDGLDNNENFLGGQKFPTPLSAAADVTVLSNNFSAEFGRTANGIVNVTSKGGGNEVKGDAYVLYRPGRPIDSASPFPRRDLTGNPVGDSFSRVQAGGSIGGPIVRDKTFIYAALEYTRDINDNVVDSPALGITGAVRGINTFYLGSLRIDHKLTDDWSLSARFNYGDVAIERPGGSLGGGNVSFPSSGSFEVRKSTLAALTAVYRGDRLTYQGSFQYSRFDWPFARARAGGPQVTALGPTGLTVAVVGDPGYVFNETENSYQTQHKLTLDLGDHRLKIGGEFLHSDFALAGGGNPNGNYTVRLTQAQLDSLRPRGLALGAQDILSLNPVVANYGVEIRPATFGTGQSQVNAYVEDEWQLRPNLTATLGLRWDYDSLSAQGGNGGDFNNIAPRFAVNYQPDAKSAIRFGVGLYYDKIPYAIISDALQRSTTSPAFVGQLNQLVALGILPANTNIAAATFDGNLTVNPACTIVATCPPASSVAGLRDTTSSDEIRIRNPRGYDNPYSLQLTLGYQREVATNFTAKVDLIYNRSYNLVRLRDLNAPAPFTPNAAALTDANIAALRAAPTNAARLALAQTLGLVRSQAAADATRPVAPVAGGARQITVSETGGTSEYQALNVQLIKERGSDWFAGRLSYTLSRLRNDTDDINFRASNGNDFASEYGPSVNDRTHVISATAYLYPIEGLTFTATGLFQSGQPVNLVPDASIFGTQDLNGSGFSFGQQYVGNANRYPGEGRNSGRLGWSRTVDLGLRYQVPILNRGLTLSADIFNLFNANNLSGFANAATTSNQVQFGGGAPFVQRNAGPPRQFQFGASWSF
ncbi:TonB-dependent receptor domain-containing protein [Sphingomonas sp. 28-63-12]|uniref:TonB-dependent receptor domain-containing protein n=1 Tax=Sphingomonas sp. 28-63-12 TaxID=1970434 RepID=UPI000BDC155C|nr:MAG: TonB-dependent receptor [Sphingomonas sp. 28-63-12]